MTLHGRIYSEAVPGTTYRVESLSPSLEGAFLRTDNQTAGDIQYARKIADRKYLIVFGDVSGNGNRAGRIADSLMKVLDELPEYDGTMDSQFLSYVDHALENSLAESKKLKNEMAKGIRDYLAEPDADGRARIHSIVQEHVESWMLPECVLEFNEQAKIRQVSSLFYEESAKIMLERGSPWVPEVPSLAEYVEYHASMLVGILDMEERKLSYINSGERYAWLIESDGTVTDLTEPGKTCLGYELEPQKDYAALKEEGVITEIMYKDALLLKLSDGVVEPLKDKHGTGGEIFLEHAVEHRGDSPLKLAYLLAELGSKEAELLKEDSTTEDDASVGVLRLA